MTAEDMGTALSAIELAEAPMLSWGDTEVSFDRPQLLAVVTQALPTSNAEALLDDLIYGEFLFEVSYLDSGPRYRSRSAETLRLLTRVRQLFPKAGDPTAEWRSRPRLVRDYRYAIRPRRVPGRVHAKDHVLDQLQGRVSQAQHAGVDAMVPEKFRFRGFQLRATLQILSDLGTARSRGVVVTAGTGGGKTLAFYLPALAHISASTDARPWVKALAVYPRNELLRDQLASVYGLARRLDGLQAQRNARPIRVGTLFQETPYKANANLNRIGWKRRSGGFECPMMTCPACGPGVLIWKDVHREAGQESLTCTDCEHVVDESTFAITRGAMRKRPPDIMFCSAEMVHRTTSDLAFAPLIGVHAVRPPRMLLLDELHTYEGITGAQTAQVLRRWQHLVEGPVEVVGLSATLPNAQTFMAELAGLDEGRVTPVTVAEHELEDIGSEYVVALRHDPTTRTATLSTTIQTLMCLSRCLDPIDDPTPVSNGVYGQRVFAFTDKLDVVNRLFADMSDAEGYTNTGRAKVGKASLAALRNPQLSTGAAQRERQRDGQSWDFPRILGHGLEAGPGVLVGRVSSQDPGIDDVSTIVTATASLEVGFDDNRAGAVLQHGAPTDMARFIQRKGRAGRPEAMRPWTVVVLSDYGKDRRSYQAWNALVDPQTPPKSIPVRNRYVLRMHAVHAMLDWIALKLRGHSARPRFDLAGPSDPQWYTKWQQRVEPVKELLEALLEESALQAHLQQHVAGALRISYDEATVLLWHPPRPVLLGAVPTLLRRLETEWGHVERGTHGDHHVSQVPLPDFVSRTLFESLESPDVDVEWPARFNDDNERSAVGLETILREFAPGNASRRFGYRSQREVHWIPISSHGQGYGVDLQANYPDVEVLGELPVDGGRLPLLQPRRVVLSDVPEYLGDRVRGESVWSTELTPVGVSHAVALVNSDVGSLIEGLDFYLHIDGSGIDLSRGVHATDVDLPLQGGGTDRFRSSIYDGNERVALGTRFTADAAAVRVRTPPDLPAIARSERDIERATRSSWFAHQVQTDPRLTKYANKFQLQWIEDAVVASVARRVLEGGASTEEAVEVDGEALLSEGLNLVVQTVPGGGKAESTDSRLREGLNELAAIQEFVEALADVATELVAPVDSRMETWLSTRFQTTVVTAALEAAELLASEHASADCVADVSPQRDPQILPESWLVERSPGGAGFLEQFRVELEENRDRFARVVRTLFMPGIDARTDRDLVRVLTRERAGEIWDALRNFRMASGPAPRREALGTLRRAMRRGGIAPLPSTVSSLIARIARPGSSDASDEAASELIRGWVKAEDALGFELDVRPWSSLGALRLAARGLALPGPTDWTSQLDAALSVLWPRGWRRETERMSNWNPFEPHIESFPALVWRAMEQSVPDVRVPGPQSVALVSDRLRRAGTCRVATAHGSEQALAQFLVAMAATPVDVGGLLAFGHVADASVTADDHVVTVELRESLV